MARRKFDRTEALEAARDLFWAKGYHGTSLKDLEGALGLNPGSIYAAFGSKEALFTEALEVYAEAGRVRFQALLEGPSPLAALARQLRVLGNAAPEDAPARACMLVKTLLELPTEASPLRRLAERLITEHEAAFEAAFQRAINLGELPADADPVRLARRYQADVIGLRSYAQRSGNTRAVADLAEDMAGEVEALRRA